MRHEVDWLLSNIGQLVTLAGPPGPRCGEQMRELGLIAGGAIAIEGERIVAAGEEGEVLDRFTAARRYDARGAVVMPGFVDPHTHALFAGTREGEFEERLRGRSYLEIAAAGGGIRSSVRAFRAASDEELVQQTKRRLDRMLANGTTTVEIKTGYGLSVEQELRGLKLIEMCDQSHPVDCIATFLGAHEVPDEHRGNTDGYVRLVVEEMLPRVARETRARFCDVFCEEGVFDRDQSRQILAEAHARGLSLKLHADEFVPIGGAELAAELGAVSADHLIEANEHGLLALKSAGVIAVLLPATCFSLGKGRYAPARHMMQMGIPIALATDCNPGSSMTESIPLVLSIACLEMGLQPAEAIVAATVNAAHATGVGQDRGQLAPGFLADLQVLDVPSYVSLVYHLGGGHVRRIWKRGRPIELPHPTSADLL